VIPFFIANPVTYQMLFIVAEVTKNKENAKICGVCLAEGSVIADRAVYQDIGSPVPKYNIDIVRIKYLYITNCMFFS
jgi:hypothetical protein